MIRPPLYPFQANILNVLKNQGHHLVIAPTGSGKSRIFQELAFQGKKVLVFEPLIALARQQAQKAKEMGLAVYVNVADQIEPPPENHSGGWLYFMSPEKTVRRGDMDNRCKPDWVVVDECHTVWEWGGTFRDALGEVPRWIQKNGYKNSLWLTATLPQSSESDLRKGFETLISHGAYQMSPHLKVRVVQASWPERMRLLSSVLCQSHEQGLVFTRTRDQTERLVRVFQAWGIRAQSYHAGMVSEARVRIEDEFNRGEIDWVVSTSAFGLGMDFKGLRKVVLWQPPDTVLSLAQFMGRVGRGGQIGEAQLYWSRQDLEWTLSQLKSQERCTSEFFDFAQGLLKKEEIGQIIRRHLV